MDLKEILEDKFYIAEALRIVKKLKDKVDDGNGFEYLKMGTVRGYSIQKAKHTLDSRTDVNGSTERRDKGVPEEFLVDAIEKAFSELKNEKETCIIFKYEDKFNMIIVVKRNKFKEIKMKTSLLQNRNKNNYKTRPTDDVILLESYGFDVIYV
jgi:hypothetical protein